MLSSTDRTTLPRRALLAGAVALGAVAVTGCTDSPGPTAGTGEWAFTDDVGTTVRLATRPTRVAGLTDEIAALWNLGVAPVASFGMQAAADDPQFAGKDLSGVTEVGRAYGQIDLEQLAAARPELIVTHAYPDGKGGLESLLYGFADQAQLDKVRAIAPVVAIAQRGRVDAVAARQAELAAALGVGADALAAARSEFDAAGQQLTAVARSGLSVLSIAAYESEGVYVMRAADDPSFAYYTAALGLDYPTVAPDIFFWQQLSWEEVDTYRTDIVLFSTRAMGEAALREQPTFARLPATKAGQLHAKAFYPTDHRGQAAQMREIAAVLTSSQKVT